jgi:hydrogenase maturation protease
MKRALVAGIGNVFFGDDAFGSEAARMLEDEVLATEVRVIDFGIRGIHAAFEMLDGYDVVIFIDIVARGELPGTLYLLEPSDLTPGVPDAHTMELANVIALYERMATELQPGKRARVMIVGCEPERISDGIGMSDAVTQALSQTKDLVISALSRSGIGAKTA